MSKPTILKQTNQSIQKVFDDLAAKWPSTVVSRDQITAFTGGAISKGRMANLDCLGEGPERIRMGRKVVYPIQPLVKWLMARVETIETREV